MDSFCIVCNSPISVDHPISMLCGQCVAESVANMPHHSTVDSIVRGFLRIVGISLTDTELLESAIYSMTCQHTCPNCGDDLMVVNDRSFYCHNCDHEPALVDDYSACPKCGNAQRDMLVWKGDEAREGITCTVCAEEYTL